MTNQQYGTIKIPREQYEKHNAKRKTAGLTWAEYLNDKAPAWDESRLSYDDVKAACRKVVREELPEGAIQ